jgi:hypothetical protein
MRSRTGHGPAAQIAFSCAYKCKQCTAGGLYHVALYKESKSKQPYLQNLCLFFEADLGNVCLCTVIRVPFFISVLQYMKIKTKEGWIIIENILGIPVNQTLIAYIFLVIFLTCKSLAIRLHTFILPKRYRIRKFYKF